MATHFSILAWRIPWMEEMVGYGPQGRKESDTTERLRFLQGVLVPISLVGGGARGGGVRSRARGELGLLLCLVASITPSRAGLGP